MSDPIELTVVNATPVTVAVVDGDTISVNVTESQPVAVSIEEPSAQIVEVTVGQPASISVSIGTPQTIELELPPEQVIFVNVPESGGSAQQWEQNVMQWKEPPVFVQTIAAGKVYWPGYLIPDMFGDLTNTRDHVSFLSEWINANGVRTSNPRQFLRMKVSYIP